jgi:hypothetical protein
VVLLLRGFRAHPRTANHKNNGAPDQEDPYYSQEVSLATQGAPTFSLHVSLATNISEHATQGSPVHLYEDLLTYVLEGGSSRKAKP